MKNIFAFIVLLILLSKAEAQQNTPQLLKEPANWAFERFALPPVFAPNFPFKGVEELRFSPGMFNKDSADYFSYAFVAQLDGVANMPQEKIKNYLLIYFKGLCSSTANQRKLSIDTSAINISIEKRETNNGDVIYNATLSIFGVFADGALVKLNMEVKVLNNVASAKSYLIAIASPKEKTDKVWNKLHEIQKAVSY